MSSRMGTGGQKCLLPADDGRPILLHLLDTFRFAGRKVFVIGFRGFDVVNCLMTMYDGDFVVVPQRDPRSAGQAVLCAKKVLMDAPFYVSWGDHLVEGDLRRVDRNTVWAVEVEDPRRFGVLEVEGDKVVRLEEKPEHPRSKLVCCGVYYVHDVELFWEELAKDENFEGALARLARQGRLWWRRMDRWVDLGTQDAYLEFAGK